MHFQLADQQSALLDAIGTLLERHAGPERCRELGGASPRYDHELDAAMREAGYLDVFAADGGGSLDAALIGEAVARAAGVISYGASALVAPALGLDVAGPVALTTAAHHGPVRFASDARTLLVLDGDVVRVADVAPGQFAPVDSRFGYPVGDVDHLPAGAETLGPGSGEQLVAWWRTALAVEICGTMSVALSMTVDYARERQQFGRAIGSFQAVQHRFSEMAVVAEGALWLSRETAWRGARPEAATNALVHSLRAARLLVSDTHQLTGAVGFAVEYDLHLWTMRLPALRIEAEWLAQASPVVLGARAGRTATPSG